VADADACCSVCASVDGCVAWVFNKGKCSAFDSCPWLPEHDDVFDGTSGFVEELPESYPIPDAGPDRGGPGRYQVQIGMIDIPTIKCFNSTRVNLFYPKGPGPFHAVVFSHGYDGGADTAQSWMHTLASMGLVVLVPWAHGGCDSSDWDHDHVEFAYDLLEVLNFSQVHHETLHPALAKVDWSATGIFGHSRGARMVPWAASLWPAATVNVKALVVSHGGFYYQDFGADTTVYNVSVPAMFTAGTIDKRSPGILRYYGEYLGTDKVFVNLQGGHHSEPTDMDHRTKALNAFSAHFFVCQLAKSKEDCDYIYGDDESSLCQAIPHPDDQCLVATSSPVTV